MCQSDQILGRFRQSPRTNRSRRLRDLGVDSSPIEVDEVDDQVGIDALRGLELVIDELDADIAWRDRCSACEAKRLELLSHRERFDDLSADDQVELLGAFVTAGNDLQNRTDESAGRILEESVSIKRVRATETGTIPSAGKKEPVENVAVDSDSKRTPSISMKSTIRLASMFWSGSNWS